MEQVLRNVAPEDRCQCRAGGRARPAPVAAGELPRSPFKVTPKQAPAEEPAPTSRLRRLFRG